MMTLLERIIDGARDLPQRDLVKVMSYVHRLNPRLQQEQADMLRQTYGAWIEDDASAFESTPEENRRMEDNGC